MGGEEKGRIKWRWLGGGYFEDKMEVVGVGISVSLFLVVLIFFFYLRG